MFKYLYLLVVVFLFACTDSDSPIRSYGASSSEDSTHEGLVQINSSNAFVVLGTKDKKFKYNERGELSVRFDYDFSIGKHEVTYEEFYRYATKDWGQFAYNLIDSVPVTDLTYYDAVLYANARSKDEGYDTAYTYSAVAFDEDGHCGKLEGLAYRPEAQAYRLPTEAEWVLVASASWNVEKAWTNENAESRVHRVCSFGENMLGICDMEGNAMEWVNDWLGYFKDTVVFNYVGAPDGGYTGERVIKGGSFSSSKKNVNYVSRGDVYTVTSTSRALYVGFRIAFGSIPNPTWMNEKGVSSAERIIPAVHSSTIRSKTGTTHSKLVFRNDVTGNLAFIDYAYAYRMVNEIQDTLDCYHPDVSPDGQRVAFSTGIEGVSGTSHVYVRKLTDVGDSLVKLDVESASIPRWRVVDGDTVIVYVTDGGNNANESNFKSQSTWQVPFRNNKFGKPVKIMDGGYHGGISHDNRLAVTGARLLRARIADSISTVMDGKFIDTVWYNREQACNASLAQDSSKRTLFLDFGSSTGKEFVGSSYGVHERLFIADSTGKLIQSIAAPKNYSFDHAEWVIGGYLRSKYDEQNLVIATLTNSNGSHEKIVLIDLQDSSVTTLAESAELWHPCLWVDKYAVITDPQVLKLNADSAAIYYETADDPLITSKMNPFWNKSNFIRVVGLGSSRMSLGFVSNKISVGAAFNMATIPSDLDVSYYFAVNYVLKHCKKLQALVVGLDFDLWMDKPGSNLKRNIANNPGFTYDANHDFWEDDGDYQAIKKLSNIFVRDNSHLRFISTKMGWIEMTDKNSWDEGNFGYDAIVADSNWSNSSTNINLYMDELRDLVEQAKEKGVVVIGVIFPQSPSYRKTGTFGRHGMRRSHAMALIERVENMTEEYSNFYLMDENKMGNHDYADSLALDYDHLNSSGAERITAKIDSALKVILGK